LPLADERLVAIGDCVQDVGVPHRFGDGLHARWKWFRRALSQQVEDFMAQLREPACDQVVNPEARARRVRLWMWSNANVAEGGVTVLG